MRTDPTAALNNGTLNFREYDRTLSRVRSTAQRIKKLIEALDEDREKLEAAGHPAPALILDEATTTMRVALRHLAEVFRSEL